MCIRDRIKDCHLVYVQSIGGPAAAKVVRAGAHPVKIAKAAPARDILAQLQQSLSLIHISEPTRPY